MKKKTKEIFEESGKSDFTPMIDIIFLLLIFFILTTKFIPNEKAISSILPTKTGTTGTPPPIPLEKPINIKVFPAGMLRGFQPSDYRNIWDKKQEKQTVLLQIGNKEPITINGRLLDPKISTISEQEKALDTIHGYIYKALQERELSNTERKKQDIVTINCFSGLPWKYSLLAYDAIRVYETDKSNIKVDVNNPLSLAEARSVNFAPPRIRNYHPNELGNELFEIIHLR